MPLPLSLTLQASVVQTGNGQSAAFDLLLSSFATDGLARRVATLLLEVTAASGTAPTLIVTIETSPNTSSWKTVLSFTTVTAITFERLTFAPLERYVRARWTIAGPVSPSFTFAISGSAEVIYADNEDFYRYGLPKVAVQDLDPVDLLSRELLAASSFFNSKIPRAYTLPLKEPYPESLKQKVCEFAAYPMLCVRGFDPDDAGDKEVKDRHEDAEEWAQDLGDGTVPDWIDATPDVTDFGGAIVSQPRRGY